MLINRDRANSAENVKQDQIRLGKIWFNSMPRRDQANLIGKEKRHQERSGKIWVSNSMLNFDQVR